MYSVTDSRAGEGPPHPLLRLAAVGQAWGLASLRRYGTSWYSALVLKRWRKLDAEDLDRARMVGRGLPIRDD